MQLRRIRKGKGQTFCKLQAREVITICDHLGFLRRSELEEEILREPLRIALHRLIEGSGLNPVDGGQVGIDQSLALADVQDE